MNRAERIYRLHRLLEGNQPVPLPTMMQSLEASRATVVRDLAYMRHFMEAPIVFDRQGGGYRYDGEAKSFELPGLWFNESELHALLAIEQLLASVQPGLLGHCIAPLKARIQNLLEENAPEGETLTDRIHLKASAPRRHDERWFPQVAAAVLKGRMLHLHYEGRERGELTERDVHPQRLIHWRDHWYLVAWCERADHLRTFALDRIRLLKETGQPVRPIEPDQLERYLRGGFGIFGGPAKERAVLRFTQRAAEWVADEIWHPDQSGAWRGEYYELEVPYSDPRELLADILKHGPDVEVLAPEKLRHLVATRLRDAAAQYPEGKGNSKACLRAHGADDPNFTGLACGRAFCPKGKTAEECTCNQAREKGGCDAGCPLLQEGCDGSCSGMSG